MGTIRKVIGALLLITAILVTQIPVVETSAAPNSDFQIDKTTLVKYTGTATSVSIPSTVKTIGPEAFAGNTTLTSVSIGDNVTEIEYGAFKDCSYLSTVKLSDSLTAIGNAAFSNNTSLRSIVLPKELKTLGSGVFAGCDKLTTIEISQDNPEFVFEKNALYDKNKTLLKVGDRITPDKGRDLLIVSVAYVKDYDAECMFGQQVEDPLAFSLLTQENLSLQWTKVSI